MHCFRRFLYGLVVSLFGLTGPVLQAGDTRIATTISARVGNGYKRVSRPDGSFKPEYYAISNGGRVPGTTTDVTIDRVSYPEVAAVAMRLLADQNYHLGKDSQEATLLIVLQWGATITYNRGNYENRVQSVARALAAAQAAGPGGGAIPVSAINASPQAAVAAAAQGAFESELLQLSAENRMRDSINGPNARLLGYMDDLKEAGTLARHTGLADRYHDLIADIEEPRYYIVVTAYDLQDLVKHDRKTLRWKTRVSVRTPGNRFDDSAAAMLKSAAKYFGQENLKLIRAQEDKGTVRLGDVEFMGEAKEPAKKK